MTNKYFIFCVLLLAFIVYEYTHLQNKFKIYELGYESGFKMGHQEYFLEKFFANHVEYGDISESNILSSKVNVLGNSKNVKAQVLKFKND